MADDAAGGKEPGVLERLTETFIAGIELLEAEGRVARDRLVATIGALVVLVVCGIAGLIGLLAAAVGITWVLALAIGPGGALAIVGIVLLAASVLVARITVVRLRRPAVEPAEAPGREAAAPAPEPEAAAEGDAALPESSAAATVEEVMPAALTRNPPP